MANREKPYILFKINQYQRFELHPTKSITSEIFAPASPRCGVVWASAHHQVALLSKQPLCFSPEDPRCLFMRGLRSEPGIFLKLFYLYIGTGAWNPEFWVPSGMLCTCSKQNDTCHQIPYSYRSLDILLFYNNIWPAIHTLSPAVLQDQELASTDVLQVVQTFLVWSETYLAMANL